MTTLASILLAFAIGALVAFKLAAFAVVAFCRLFVSWIHKAI